MRSVHLHAVRASAIAIAIAIVAPLQGGDWHYRSHLVCSDCHTQHNSENNQPMRSDNDATPAVGLLRRGTPLELCLSCHDGSDPAAPDVVAPVSYVLDSAAGPFPNRGGIATPIAHHLNGSSPEVPPGGTKPMVLVCTTCHDPHGNGNYRNLRPDPAAVGQIAVSVIAKQAAIADGTNPAQVYVPQNVIYRSGISKWCNDCHGDPSGSHPVDVPIWGSTFADYPTWASVTLPRVPVYSASDLAVPSRDNQVMCLSCHKAHGSPNPSTTIYADGATIDSTCQECHNQ